MRRHFLTAISVGALALASRKAAAAPANRAPDAVGEPVKVVYHLSEGIDQAAHALGNIRNHLRAEPGTKIVVVALADGIRFLLREAVDRNGKPFEPQIAALVENGVEFRICNNTLSAHHVAPERVVPQAVIVPAGVAEIARLQAKEGFAYLRP